MWIGVVATYQVRVYGLAANRSVVVCRASDANVSSIRHLAVTSSHLSIVVVKALLADFVFLDEE